MPRSRQPSIGITSYKEMIASGEGLPAVTKQAQLVEIMGRHLGDVVSGAKSAQEGMDAAAQELKALL